MTTMKVSAAERRQLEIDRKMRADFKAAERDRKAAERKTDKVAVGRA